MSMNVDHQGSPPQLNDQGIIELVQVSFENYSDMPNIYDITARESSILPLSIDAGFQDRNDTAAEPEAQEVDCVEAGEDGREVVALERRY